MDILCTDKTGTLTEGIVKLDSAIDLHGQPSSETLQAAFLNASLEAGIANPLDEALVAAGISAKLSVHDERKLGEIPYDFTRRRLTIIVKDMDTPAGFVRLPRAHSPKCCRSAPR